MRELSADVRLPDGAAAASAARSAVRAVLLGWDLTDEDWVYDATLIVSELVSNAVRHGGGCLELRVRLDGDGRVVLTVSDRSTRVPQRRHSDERTAGGRGISFVDALAAGWSADVHRDGKDVWVRLAPYPQAPG
ncbi:ATP-binding protein [Actinoplanes sp. NPDC049802]|uniref:ATP-binding protein n=1 Tax=Actinoplanes sp. NPDC049802 TaxID=3154742 RepID=UPI0033F91B0B